jgi:hypothetical protein
MSILPLGIDTPHLLNRHVRYLLLKDEMSISIVDTIKNEAFIISHAEFNRINSNKGSIPTLNSIAIKWIDSEDENTRE